MESAWEGRGRGVGGAWDGERHGRCVGGAWEQRESSVEQVVLEATDVLAVSDVRQVLVLSCNFFQVVLGFWLQEGSELFLGYGNMASKARCVASSPPVPWPSFDPSSSSLSIHASPFCFSTHIRQSSFGFRQPLRSISRRPAAASRSIMAILAQTSHSSDTAGCGPALQCAGLAG